MSEFHHPPDPWLERELKSVPLPEGLAMRLKQIGLGPDAQLDAALCDIGLPQGLAARLKALAREDALDHALRAVPTPAGLLTKLHDISTYSDAELDAQLRDVETPAGLRQRLRAIARRRRVPAIWLRTPAAQWVLAASLMLAVGMLYFTAMAGMLSSIHGVVAQSGQDALRPEPTEIVASMAPEPPVVSFFVEAPSNAEKLASTATTAESLDIHNPLAPLPPPSTVAQVEQLFDSQPAAAMAGEVDPQSAPTAPRPLAATPAAPDTLPALEVIELQPPRGVAPPQIKQFDLLALLKDGVHPFVDPAGHPQLAVNTAPLVTRKTSYQRTRDALLQGRLIDGSEIRVEEFLAAVDYNFPLPHDAALGVRTAAGPSPFGDEGMQLMQIGVQAGDSPLLVRPAVHLTLAVDISASMRRGERLAEIHRAIAEFLPHLAARDQLAVVVFSERADVLFNGAGRDDVELVLPMLAALRPRSATNLSAGLQLATDIAIHAPVDERMARRLVVLTDGLGQIPQSVAAQVEALVAETVQQGVQVEMIDVGPDSALDQQLESLALAADSSVRYAEGADAIRYLLQETLTGQSQVIAHAARLSVHFNPKTVDSYRLLGHEADSLGGLEGGALETDLRTGEAATALYEIKLKPGGGDDVARVMLTWRDPQTSAEQQVVQRVSRLQFATALWESPVSLQRAAVVAETAEILRGSKFAPSGVQGLRRVWEVSQQLSPPARQEASFRRFLETLEAAQRARSGRATATGPPWWRTASR